MTIRFCGACGTEVDETAAFCPSCGRPLDDDAADAEPAQEWEEPRSDLTEESVAADPEDRAVAEPAAEPADEPGTPRPAEDEQPAVEPTAIHAAPGEHQTATPANRDESRPAPADAPREQPADTRRGAGWRAPPINVPVTWPVMFSGWLIGVGSLVGVISFLFPWTAGPGTLGLLERWGLASPINLLLLIALLGISAAVFFSAHVPDFAHRRLVILVVVVIGLGVGLDRLGLGSTGFGAVLFFLGMLAASIGALMLEVGADRPVGTSG